MFGQHVPRATHALNAIIGFSELMHDGKAGGPVSAAQKEYLGDILNSATHLLQLINDVLDLSKVEAGRMEVLKSTFRIEEIISEATQNVAPIMSVKRTKAYPRDSTGSCADHHR
ncbi:MAG TPA: histidine kinase dimerization/phospho-acceptor domain-containing protein [Candidatus Binatia bacterium]|nr:histidine kinase dimerization/phospho-acceptor domain-containing protein [Candidatus Binatia bacterium]